MTGSSKGSSFGQDYATIKYNAAGQQQWVARYDGPANSDDGAKAMAIDGAGNTYVTGYSSGSFGQDYATIKYDSAGQQQWVRRYNGPANSDDEATAMAVDASGSVYVTGQSYDSGFGYDYATIKYNSAGQQQWVTRYEGLGDTNQPTAIALDGSGNVFVTGYSFGSDTNYDYATIKYVQGATPTPTATPNPRRSPRPRPTPAPRPSP